MTIFTKIINQEIPSYKIFENDLVYAFLSREQINLGHTLIVPKIEVDHFYDVEEPYFSEVFRIGKVVAQAIKSVTNCDRVGLQVLGFEVPHFHLHVIPLNSIGDIAKVAKIYSDEECKKIAAEISNAMI